MDGGMFGPPGGTQNIRGGLGGGQMTDREFQQILEGLRRSQSPTGGAIGGTLPAYDSPAPRGGPAAPQGVPGIGDSGIDPNMIAQVGAAGGGLDKIDFGTQSFDDGMGGMQDAITSMGRQKMEEERLRRLFAEMAAQGGGMGAGSVAGGGFTSPRGGTGPTGMGWVPPTR